jgi:hypothetical protein
MVIVQLNKLEPRVVGSVEEIDLSSLNLVSCKNAGIKTALEFYQHPFITNHIALLKSYLSWDYKYYLVDVKLHQLRVGQIPCIPGWHVDGGPDIPSQYALCALGSSLTQFNLSPLSYFYKDMKTFCSQFKDVSVAPKDILTLKSGDIVLYENLNVHRGMPATYDGPRLLIRVMGSDKIKPIPMKNTWKPICIEAPLNYGR